MNKAVCVILFLILMVLTACMPRSSQATSAPATDTPPVVDLAPTGGNDDSSLDVGSRRISPIDGMTMVFVPGGEFRMGSEAGLTDEQPIHTVRLDSFWLDKTEVTNDMYQACVQDGKCSRPNLTGSYEDQQTSLSYFDDPKLSDHPVAFVSWNDASNYCAWADRRLPTEAEWEKAAIWDPASNTQRVYPWGNDFDCRKGNFDDELALDASIMPATTPNCDGYPRSAPVGSFPAGASPYGALDMGGNVWEWVNDAFIETDPFTQTVNYYAISPSYNPPGEFTTSNMQGLEAS